MSHRNLSLLALIMCFSISLISQDFLANYELYQDSEIENRFIQPEHVEKRVLALRDNDRFRVQKEGESLEGRNIYSVAWGEGETDVLMWTQMHGDESTATLAVMDLFNFLSAEDGNTELREKLHSNLTIHIIPMMNPDGAVRFSRRNALGIDLNRDALRLQNPESRVLKKVRDRTEAEIGFNLHDQSRYYNAGNSPNTATFSLLAPAYNYAKDVNDVRKRALKICVELNNYFQEKLPNQVGRYDDTFEPRAFGDNIQKWGTSAILIECGGLKDDPEKQKIRKIHYGALLSVMNSIVDGAYRDNTVEEYFEIPDNNRNMQDLIIREINYDRYDESFILDIAFKRSESYDQKDQIMRYSGYISDLGDLSTSYGYREIDAKGCTVEWPETINSQVKPNADNAWDYIGEGKAIYPDSDPDEELRTLPVKIVSPKDSIDQIIFPGKNPTFYISCDGESKYYVNDGRVYELGE